MFSSRSPSWSTASFLSAAVEVFFSGWRILLYKVFHPNTSLHILLPADDNYKEVKKWAFKLTTWWECGPPHLALHTHLEAGLSDMSDSFDR